MPPTLLPRQVDEVHLPRVLASALGELAAREMRGWVVGDVFAAPGVIAAAAILLQYLAFGRRAVHHVVPALLAPTAVLLGLLLALTVAFLPAVLGQAPLQHVPAPGDHVITLGALAVHTAVLFDLAVFFLVFGFVVGVLDRFGAAAERPHP